MDPWGGGSGATDGADACGGGSGEAGGRKILPLAPDSTVSGKGKFFMRLEWVVAL